MNMRVRVIACLAILSVLLSVIIFSECMGNVSHDPEYTSYDEGIASNTGVYFMENWNERGRLYQLDDKGDVLEMQNSGVVGMHYIDAIEIANDSVYALYSDFRNIGGDTYNTYVIASHTSSLEPVAVTDPFIIDITENVTDLCSDGEAMYITTVNRDGNSIKVYAVPMERLIDIADREDSVVNPLTGESDSTQDAGELKSPDVLMFRESPIGRYYADAYYDGTNVIIRTDADQPEGYFPVKMLQSLIDNIFQ